MVNLKSQKRVIGATLGVGVIVALVTIIAPPIRDRLVFYAFEMVCDLGFTDSALWLKRRVELSPTGVQLAVDRVSCWGSGSELYCKAVVIGTPLQEVVVSSLREAAKDKSAKVSKRLEIYRLLWLRTGERTWLIEWFTLAREGRHPVSGAARIEMWGTFADLDLNEKIRVSTTNDIDLTVEEFTKRVYEHPMLEPH